MAKRKKKPIFWVVERKPFRHWIAMIDTVATSRTNSIIKYGNGTTSPLRLWNELEDGTIRCVPLVLGTVPRRRK